MLLLGTAASGLRAQQDALNILGNNMANLDTTGYKANQIDFAETLATLERSANPGGTGGTANPAGTLGNLSVGSGVLYNAVGTDFQQGVLASTGRPLDLGINGLGFFQVKLPDGTTGYTRDGALEVDGAGQLTDSKGNIIQPPITIPQGTTDLAVAANGIITGDVNGTTKPLGQISLAVFTNPGSLQNLGNNIFTPMASSATPQVGAPGSAMGNQVLGTIQSQSLEQSNANMTTLMTDLIQAQRAYQLNANMVTDGDQMWSLANSLRR